MKSATGSIGFRVRKRQRKVADDVVRMAADMPVANISDSMFRLTAGGSRILPLHMGGRVVGPALTVKTRPGDNLMVHKAIEIGEPGDVIVVDAGGDLTNAIIGELMVARARERGIGGLVINGAVRDVGALRRDTFPVFAAGATHRGPYKDGPGEVNVSIAIDGMVIEPGDLIVGDEDGIVCVPYGDAESVLRAAAAKHREEQILMASIKSNSADRSWIDEALTSRNCEVEV